MTFPTPLPPLPIAWLPVKHGFAFIGVKRDGTRVPCHVELGPDGRHTVTGGLFKELVGWVVPDEGEARQGRTEVMGITATREQVAEWERKGLIAAEQVTASLPAPPEVGPMVVPSFAAPATWTIPIVLPSLANGRDWRQRSRVTQSHRLAVSRALAPQLAALVPFAHAYHHAGRSVACRLTRLGGRRLDAMANLPGSLKYVEDAVCLMLGIDDASDRWHCECKQEPGGPTGVRIEIRIG